LRNRWTTPASSCRWSPATAYVRGLRPGDDGCPGKIPQLRAAFTGHVDDDHRFLLAKMLARVDGIDTDIAALDAQIGTHLAPFAPVALRLDEALGQR